MITILAEFKIIGSSQVSMLTKYYLLNSLCLLQVLSVIECDNAT